MDTYYNYVLFFKVPPHDLLLTQDLFRSFRGNKWKEVPSKRKVALVLNHLNFFTKMVDKMELLWFIFTMRDFNPQFRYIVQK